MSAKTLRLLNSTHPAKQIPAIGFGTWQAQPGEVEKAVEVALKVGYKHLDCAAIYKNEGEVGEGLKKSGVDRESLWITSKLWNINHRPDLVEGACRQTLKDLGINYLDLYLIHWPVPWKAGSHIKDFPAPSPDLRDNDITLAQTWAAMESLVEKGLTRNIGVSNFTKSEVEEVLKTAKIKPAAIQMEIHPYLAQQDYVKWLQAQGLLVTAYSPLGNQNPIYGGKGGVLLRENPVIVEIAKKHGKTTSQICLSWGATRNTPVIPKSVNPERIKENLDIMELDADDMAKINALDSNSRLNDPSTNFGYVMFADEKPAYQTALHSITNAGQKAFQAAKGLAGQA